MTIPEIRDDDHSAGPTQHFGPDVTMQWIDGGRLLTIFIQTSTEASYKAWEAEMRALVSQWPTNRTICIFYDIRSPRYAISPQIAMAFQRLSRDYRHLPARSAILYTGQSFTTVFMGLLQMLPVAPWQRREFFTNYYTAIDWLRSEFRGNLLGSLDNSGVTR